MKSDIKFYDTSSLLLASNDIFREKFVISSVTLEELEKIKQSSGKDETIKYQARRLLRLLEENPSSYDVVIHHLEYEVQIVKNGILINNDTRILSDAIWYNNIEMPDEITFVTNDLALKNIANLYFGDGCITKVNESDDYRGFRDLKPSQTMLCSFYEVPSRNLFDCGVNEYLILRDEDNKIIDLRCWTGQEYRHVGNLSFDSAWFGKVRPKDIYQKMAFDSLAHNQITMLRGDAGTGKSHLAMAYLMQQLQRGAIDKIIMLCNPVATINAARLGFYPGSCDEKILDSQIGNFLSGKLGNKEGVLRLIEQEKLMLVPLSDARGLDTSDMRAAIYITEAQNMDKTLMKLALQRVGEDCICIVEGDDNTQVDLQAYAGFNNGMKAASKAFRGEDIYGEVMLQKIYRSRIAEIANKI